MKYKFGHLSAQHAESTARTVVQYLRLYDLTMPSSAASLHGLQRLLPMPWIGSTVFRIAAVAVHPKASSSHARRNRSPPATRHDINRQAAAHPSWHESCLLHERSRKT